MSHLIPKFTACATRLQGIAHNIICCDAKQKLLVEVDAFILKRIGVARKKRFFPSTTVLHAQRAEAAPLRQ
jgi:hypothetical protein